MGWVFRKSFGRGPFRWTLSKRGVGWSVGIPGLRYGVSPSGQRYVSVGIPNTGLYWIKHFWHAMGCGIWMWKREH